MTLDEAFDWLLRVDGRLYRSPRSGDKDHGWIAVVDLPQAPALGNPRMREIVAVGATMQEATAAAEQHWEVFWEGLGTLH